MGVTLVTKKNKQLTTMDKLKDGQLAVIVDQRFGYAGRVVQRYKEHCVSIGRESGYGWEYCEKVGLLVRILNAGELIEVF